MKTIRLFLLFAFFTASLMAGSPTLKSISVDGDSSDWTEVLANPLQVTQDGDGSSMDPSQCSTLSTDRDCPVGTVGRDLGTFAWTFDNTYIYIYQTRLGSSSNQQDFWFYMDVGQDQLMDTGDFVLHVSYKGANRNTDVELYAYVQEGADPDPMVDVDGWADGYTEPGRLGSVLHYYGNTKAGFSDGSGFETRVPWADLGVPAGTGIFFHVGSSNSSNLPSQIDDNCGGPDGGLGTFGFYLVDLRSDNTSSTQSGTTLVYTHEVENTGTFDERINLVLTSTSGFHLTLIDDASGDVMGIDANGDGDFSDPGDTLNAAYDGDGDGYPDTGVITPDTIVTLRVEIVIPAGTPNMTDSTTISTSVSGEDADDSVVDTTVIGDIQVDPDQSFSATAGSVLSLPHAVVHYLLQDTIALKGTSLQGWSLSFYTDPEGDGVPNTLMATDVDGDGDFSDASDYLDPTYDTNGDLFPDTGLLSAGSPWPFVVTVTVPAGTAEGTVDTVTIYGVTTAVNNSVQDTAIDTVTVKPRIAIDPDYLTSEGNNYYSAAGLSVFFPHVVTNAFGTPDGATLSYSASDGATVLFWSDPDCDGSVSDGSIITQTGTLAANGGSECVVAEGQIPFSVTQGTTVVIQVTATSVADPSFSDTATDEVRISYLVPYRDATYTNSGINFSHCSTLYVKGYNFTPGVTYNLHYDDIVPTEKRLVPMIADGFGQYRDGYTFGASDLTGSWTVYADDGSSTWDTITVTLEPDGNVNAIDPFGTGRQRYDTTDNVSIASTLNNTNLGGDYFGGTLKTVILSNDGTLYWDGAAFQPYSGSEWSRVRAGVDLPASSTLDDLYTFNGVAFPTSGVWQVKAEWRASCGYGIATGQNTFLVGTTLSTYTDTTFTTTTDSFYLHDPVYLAGDYYYPSTILVVAYYDDTGALVDIGSLPTDPTGYGSLTQDTSGWSSEGTIHAVVYPSGYTPLALYTPSDPNLLGSKDFTLIRLPGLLRNDQYATLGTAIFKQAYPADPALDPAGDLEKADFHSLDAFAHESSDLGGSAPSIIFYELDKAGDTLRVNKSAGKIVITY